jgi:hypothetical protein
VGTRAKECADIQEGTPLPVYDAMLERTRGIRRALSAHGLRRLYGSVDRRDTSCVRSPA